MKFRFPIVIIDEDYRADNISGLGIRALAKAIEDEEDMLDFAACTTRNSRLSCQITLTEALDGLTVHIPPESRNMQGR